MIDKLQQGARHAAAVQDVDVLLIVLEPGVLIRGDVAPNGPMGVKRELVTWEQVMNGRLESTIDRVAEIVRRHG